nr:hypothetical protein [Photobacterium leiognathi]
MEQAEWGSADMKITCSMGVAELRTKNTTSIERADKALLKAKERGRNRVEIAWNESQL